MKIRVDFYYDDDNLEDALERAFEGYDLTYEVITKQGPGGGWPVVEITGDREELARWLINSYDDEDLDLYKVKS